MSDKTIASVLVESSFAVIVKVPVTLILAVFVTLPPAVIFKLATSISPSVRFLKKSAAFIAKISETIEPWLIAV